MDLPLLFSSAIVLILLNMITILLRLKMKSGKSLIKVISLEFFVFLALSIFFFILSLYLIFAERNNESFIMALIMFLFSIYFGICSIIIKNSITQKGIIFLNSFPHLLKWNDIQRFAINGKRIYFKSKKGYSSIIVYNKNIKAFQNLLNIKISYSPKNNY